MKILHAFHTDRSANIGIIFALALLPVAAGLGTAVDYSRAANARTAIQTLADAAALASAALPDNSDSARIAAAMAFFDAKRAQDPNLVSNPTALVSLTENTVTVTSQGAVASSILSVLGITQIPVHATSTASRAIDGPPVCILALNRTANDAVAFSGGTSFIGENCAIYSNSSSASAISISGTALVKSAGMCAYGSVSDLVGVTPKPLTGCPRVEDPFKNVPTTTAVGCSYNKVSVQPHESVMLNPGTYCNNLSLKGNVTLTPGLYVIKNGALNVDSQATVTGDGVTFYLSGSGASFTINAGGKISLTAMTSGAYKGMLIVQDRFSNAGAVNNLNGNSDTYLKGAIYLPTKSCRWLAAGLLARKLNIWRSSPTP